ncbi:MAG: biotin-dependent carboxyltransferase family protein [Pseudorhodobacter sp.]
MSFEILSAGPMLTIQDEGRLGLRHQGISGAGPVDLPAMAMANALTGNDPGAAVLEFAGPAGRFSCDSPLRFAVTGGKCVIRRDGQVLAWAEAHRLRPGEVLEIGAPQDTVWGYLALSGGIATQPVLGARATHLRSGLGGVDGQRLRDGMHLPVGSAAEGPCLRAPSALISALQDGPIRIVPGPQDDFFTPEIRTRLLETPFFVTAQRDRMAMVLGGEELPAFRGHDIVSDGTVPGSIQVPGSAVPIVLLCESQTSGGYPKIATVISTDLPRLAQMPVGAHFRFAVVTRDEAEEILIEARHRFRATLAGLVPKAEGELRSDYLLAQDLVGGVFEPEEIIRPVRRGGQS